MTPAWHARLDRLAPYVFLAHVVLAAVCTWRMACSSSWVWCAVGMVVTMLNSRQFVDSLIEVAR